MQLIEKLIELGGVLYFVQEYNVLFWVLYMFGCWLLYFYLSNLRDEGMYVVNECI